MKPLKKILLRTAFVIVTLFLLTPDTQARKVLTDQTWDRCSRKPLANQVIQTRIVSISMIINHMPISITQSEELARKIIEEAGTAKSDRKKIQGMAHDTAVGLHICVRSII